MPYFNYPEYVYRSGFLNGSDHSAAQSKIAVFTNFMINGLLKSLITHTLPFGEGGVCVIKDFTV